MATANDNAFTDKAYFCPKCGSALVDASSFIGGAATCGVCAWAGRVEELATVPFRQESGSPEEISRQLTLDIRQLLAKNTANELVRLLAKWGFIGPQINKEEVARYFGGVAKGIARGILETRQELERERSVQG